MKIKLVKVAGRPFDTEVPLLRTIEGIEQSRPCIGCVYEIYPVFGIDGVGTKRPTYFKTSMVVAIEGNEIRTLDSTYTLDKIE